MHYPEFTGSLHKCWNNVPERVTMEAIKMETIRIRDSEFTPCRMMVLDLNYSTNGPKSLWDWIRVIWNYDIFIQDKIPFMKSLILANIIVWFLF